MNTELATTQDNVANRDAAKYRKPRYIVHSEDNAYRLEVHLPGVLKDGARITLDGNLLSIDADAVDVASVDWKTLRRERPEGGFRLRLELNVDIDESGVKASVADGLLTVTLPLAAKAAKRSIAIE